MMVLSSKYLGTMAKLTLVSSAAKPTEPQAKAAQKKARKPRFPILTDLTFEEQMKYILEAHDALLAFQVPNKDYTVKDALLLLAEKKDEDFPGRYGLQITLKELGVHVELPETMWEWRERYFASFELEPGFEWDPDDYARMKPLIGDETRLAAVDTSIPGESPLPIGWVYFPALNFAHVRKLVRPILHHYDVLQGPSRSLHSAFPLFHTNYRHLLDFRAIMAHYWPTYACAEYQRVEDMADREAVKAKATAAPEAAISEAHATILNHNLWTDNHPLTVRDALTHVRNELRKKYAGEPHEDWNKPGGWRAMLATLEDRGIKVCVDEPYAGIVVSPARLCNVLPKDWILKRYKKLLGNTVAGAREVQFKLYC